MKTVPFRPLRQVKKTGQIMVASYAQWRRVMSADNGDFQLSLDREYAGLPADEQVYNHAGQPLFWRDFDPTQIPVFEYSSLLDVTRIQDEHASYAIRWFPGGRLTYACSRLHLDCDGVPAFSHYTIEHVAEHLADFAQYEPLTVGVVVKWWGWFLYQLENVRL
jgi:hypothetical protein